METIHTDNMANKEIEIYVPETLYDINLASYMVYHKVMLIEGLKPMEKVIQLIASMNNLDEKDVRKLPIEEIDRVGVILLRLFQADAREYTLDDVRQIDIDDKKYGLIPDFNKMETGAYIDLVDLMQNVPENLHKIMAVLYRPIAKSYGSLYDLTEYSTEVDKIKNEREDVFLKKMPYAIARATVNFMKGLMANLQTDTTTDSIKPLK